LLAANNRHRSRGTDRERRERSMIGRVVLAECASLRHSLGLIVGN
jgi:hypothetical protein